MIFSVYCLRTKHLMYYRRKIELALIQAFGGELSKMDFQKLLFLLTQKQQKPAYDFIPYHYGCFSFLAMDDLKALVHKGHLLDKDQKWKLPGRAAYFSALTEEDKSIILKLKSAFINNLGTALVRHTYVHYPYYAINSKIASTILKDEELKVVDQFRPSSDGYHLYTIGYEGTSIELYLNKLLRQNIKLLCDVRRNALSMKFGFSKNQLKASCESVGISYVHIADLGIESDKRKELKDQEDYDELFEEYDKTTLPNRTEAINKVRKLIQTYNRIALTCFESSPRQCHRSRLAAFIVKSSDFSFELTHL